MESETLLVSVSPLNPFLNGDSEREDDDCALDELANGALGGSRGVVMLGNIGWVEPVFERVESAERLE
jgi:hypothetical protein